MMHGCRGMCVDLAIRAGKTPGIFYEPWKQKHLPFYIYVVENAIVSAQGVVGNIDGVIQLKGAHLWIKVMHILYVY